MNLKKGIKTRRSIRKFTTEIVSEIDLEDVVELASYSPSWKNTQTPRYVIVRNKEILAKIANEGVMNFEKNKETILGCSALVVVTSVSKRCGYERDGSFTTKKQDKWEMFDAGVAAQTFMLAAHEKGIGSVVLGIFDEDYIAQIIQLEEDRTVSALIAVGYPAEKPDAPKRKPLKELVRFIS
ncbi:MAG: nitroreductase family protein [Lachnospiraceae bacterium]|nr:nitroreductase family protein [Lachnospiraceae bacterium]